MSDDPFRPPTDAEIDAAQAKLGFPFPADYRAFLKRAEDVSDAGFEAAAILPGAGHLDLFEIAREAWEEMELPRDLLPFVEDNGDYFCLTREGGVAFWSHNGQVDETWPSFDAWYEQVVLEELDEDDEDDDGYDDDEDEDDADGDRD